MEYSKRKKKVQIIVAKLNNKIKWKKEYFDSFQIFFLSPPKNLGKNVFAFLQGTRIHELDNKTGTAGFSGLYTWGRDRWQERRPGTGHDSEENWLRFSMTTSLAREVKLPWKKAAYAPERSGN